MRMPCSMPGHDWRLEGCLDAVGFKIPRDSEPSPRPATRKETIIIITILVLFCSGAMIASVILLLRMFGIPFKSHGKNAVEASVAGNDERTGDGNGMCA